jgi:hypothetical protein
MQKSLSKSCKLRYTALECKASTTEEGTIFYQRGVDGCVCFVNHIGVRLTAEPFALRSIE